MPAKKDLSKDEKILSFWNFDLNETNLETLSIQGDGEYEWRCFKGHEFKAKVKSIYYGKVPCPYCDNRVAIIGETDFGTLFPKWSTMIYGSKKYIENSKKLHVRSTRKILFRCGENHIFKKAINKIKNDDSIICSYCNGSKFDSEINSLAVCYPNLLKDWDVAKNKLTPNEVTKNSSKKYYWKCSDCSIERFMTVQNRIKYNCSYCRSGINAGKFFKSGVNDLGTLYPEVSERFDYIRNEPYSSPSQIPANSKKKYWFYCKNCSYSLYNSVYRFTKRELLCGYCNGQSHLSYYNDIGTRFPELAKNWSSNNADSIYEKFLIYDGEIYLWKCENNKHEYSSSIHSILKKGSCIKCSKFDSNIEKEIFEFISANYTGSIIISDRTVLKPKEIDLLLPNLNIAIEVNGDYWHSINSNRFNNDKEVVVFHENKVNECALKGIELLFIWESDWKHNKAVVKNELLKRLRGKKALDIFSRVI